MFGEDDWLILLTISKKAGSNEYGQLGDGTEESRKRPKKVKLLQTEFVISVSCGAHCTAAIAEPRENDGTSSTHRLWIWGQNQVLDFYLSFEGFYIVLSRFMSPCDKLCGSLTNLFLSYQGSNHPRIFWGAFTPNTVSDFFFCTSWIQCNRRLISVDILD